MGRTPARMVSRFCGNPAPSAARSQISGGPPGIAESRFRRRSSANGVFPGTGRIPARHGSRKPAWPAGRRAARPAPVRAPGEVIIELLREFITHGRSKVDPVVVESGTCRSRPDVSTRHDVWFPNAGRYIGTDFQKGLDVDVVADAHRFTEAFEAESIDILISCSVFEHLKYPFLAAHEAMKSLKIGGLLFVQTHQSFPIHAFPHDYFRFTKEGLAGLFGSEMGFQVIGSDYEFPAQVLAECDPGTANGSAFLNVCLYGIKVAPTPDTYRFEYDAPD